MCESLGFLINEQPTHTSCGPTCLHGIYSYYEDNISLKKIIEEVSDFADGGGTLGVILANHALSRGYEVCIYTYNINVFDPTWFELDSQTLISVLVKRRDRNSISQKEFYALNSYINFLKCGGTIRMENLSISLIEKNIEG